jgi:energy-coupling factor transporter ATP-binding protein EcfA2
MNQDPHSNGSENPITHQQQSFGDLQVQGRDNILNAINATGDVTLNQQKIYQIRREEIQQELNATSPYKGLKQFEPRDSDRFFGRDQFIRQLMGDLQQTNFILLLGASGSGKSSVVRAGLIPWFQQKWGERFTCLTMTPDRDPFESLYGSLLAQSYTQAQAQIAKAVKVETLSQVVEKLKPPEAFWLIFIDQFEELFTVSEHNSRDRFIDSLVRLSQTSLSSVKIVATMRADFLDRLSPYASLVKVTNRHRPLIAEMQPDDLRLAIEQPAFKHGVVFETGLVEEIITAVQGQAGCLPLLQYTLDLLWEAEVKDGGIQDRTLNIRSYRDLGGVSGALEKRVEQIYEALSEPEQKATQRIFLKLVEIGGDVESGTSWKPVRRRAARSEFTETEKPVLDELIRRNLLVSDAIVQGTKTTPVATVEIVHEILLTSWKRLNDWIENNRANIAFCNRLNDDVRLWKKENSEKDLWSGSKLAHALELHRDPQFNEVLGGFSPGQWFSKG